MFLAVSLCHVGVYHHERSPIVTSVASEVPSFPVNNKTTPFLTDDFFERYWGPDYMA